MTTLTQDDIDFLKRLDNLDNIHFWVTDDKGDKVLTRDGWDKAYAEFKRIKQLSYGLPPAKYRRLLEGCQLHIGNE